MSLFGTYILENIVKIMSNYMYLLLIHIQH